MKSLLSTFWWGPDPGERHIHWVSRDILRLLKAQGGRGWRDRWLPSLPHAHPILSKEVQEVNAILATQICDSKMRDRLVWSLASKGVYSVTSGYHWKHSQVFPRLPRASSSVVTITAILWKWVWKLHTPHKLRCFMWKTLLGALPTMECHYFVGQLASCSLSGSCSLEGGFIVGDVVSNISTSVAGFLAAMPSFSVRSVHMHSRSDGHASWDAGTRGGYAGVIIQDSFGNFLNITRKSLCVSSVADAEVVAVQYGSRCLKLGEAFQDCRWSWIPRLANLAADHLASCSCVEMCDVSWVARPPSSLVHVLNKDGLPCPP
ncbi:hypothetical protein ACFX19_034994 [Malus domestica]